MSKRARYTGNPPGRVIAWPPGAVDPEKTWFVEPGKWLPEDMPAALRDELLANNPDVVEVEQHTDTTKKGDK
jgi:hypothetical protein